MNLLEKLYHSPIMSFYFKLCSIASNYGLSALILFIRIFMARIFWYSGLVKIGNMNNTIYLFKYEYKVAIINYELAAYLCALTELSMPILLVVGLFTRIATIPLLIIVAVIQFTYFDSIENLYWALLLGLITLSGPGMFSLDYLICSKIRR
jgi:putative oxidoreductase